MPARTTNTKLLLAVIACAGPSLARPAAHASTQPHAGSVGEVVVTAQRREQLQSEVPAALTAYSGDFLTALGAVDLHDVSLFTPGLVVQDKSPANANIVIRGISTDDGSAYQEPRISVFQDGVSVSRSRGAFVELFDLARIEVVRGPQTTLFGRSALAGAVNIVDNLPDERGADGALRLEGGSRNDRLASGYVNALLGGGVTVRLAGQYRHRDGYIANLLGGPALDGIDDAAVRATVDWRPTAQFRSDLIASYESDHTTGTSYKSETFDPASPATGQVLGDRNPATALTAAEPNGFEGGGALGDRRFIASETWLNQYSFSKALQLSSTTGLRHFQSVERYDLDGFALPLIGAAEDVRDTQYSQELRLTYQGEAKIGWLLGASGFRDSGSQRVPLQIDEPVLLSLLTGYLNRRNPVAGPQSLYETPEVDAALLQGLAGAYGIALPAAQARSIAENLQTSHVESSTDFNTASAYDLFGNLVYHPVPKLQIEAGARFTSERKTTGYATELPNGRSVLASFLGALSAPAGPARSGLLSLLTAPGASQLPYSPSFPLPPIGLVVQPTAGGGGKVDWSINDAGFAWRFAARYEVSSSISVYANYARGRRPEVLTAASPPQPFASPVFTRAAAETLNSVETGAKMRLLENKIRIDVAAYGNRYDHFQTQLQQGVRFITVDAGAATTYGAEAQAVFAPSRDMEIFANYAFTHARFDDGLYAGNHFRLTPDHAVSGGVLLSREALGGILRLTPSFSWRSKAFFNDDNANPALLVGAFIRPLVYNEFQNAYGLTNLRLGYEPAHGHWRIEAFVTNLLDTRYLKDAGDSGEAFGLPTYVEGEPRFVGASVTIRG